MRTAYKIFLMVLIVSLFAACGGGGGGSPPSSGNGGGGDNPTPDPEPITHVWGDNWGTLKWSSIPAAAQ